MFPEVWNTVSEAFNPVLGIISIRYVVVIIIIEECFL